MTLRTLFMGSAALACPSLRALHACPLVDLLGAVTQPDRPKGRRLALTACPVKQLAQELGVATMSPERVNTLDVLTDLAALKPELIVVVAYGQFLGTTLLSLPRYGCMNVHASLLPRYRGAAPVQWAIANGDAVTGVTTMRVNAQMDAGDILLQRDVPIEAEDTAGSLMARLGEVGAGLLIETVASHVNGTLRPQRQDATLATLAPKLHKQDGRIDWTRAAVELHNRIRAFHPWPGSFCLLAAPSAGGAEPAPALKVHRVAVEAGCGLPGMVLEAGGRGPLVATGQGALRLLEVQAPGGKAMAGSDYVRGRALRVGDLLG